MADRGVEDVRELLRDAFGRIAGLVGGVTEGLTSEQATFRPDPDANSISWLIWHLSRIQDDHVSDLAGAEQVWTSRGWAERFDLPFDAGAVGFGQSSDEVGAVRTGGELLAGYHADAHAATLRYVDRLDSAELARVVDTSWDPPVTVSVRLVSVLGDCWQHVGQAAYLLGIAKRT